MAMNTLSNAVRLSALAPGAWFTRRDDSTFWLRLYSMLLTPQDEANKALEEFMASVTKERPFISMGRPVAFSCVTLGDLKVPVFTGQLYSDETGKLRMDVNVEQKALPKALHVALCTPLKVDGTPGNEGEAKATLASAAALLCVHVGQNALRELVFDGEVNAANGTFTHPGPPWKTPHPGEGPFFARQNGADVQEIAERIARLREPRHGRIALALQLVDAGMRELSGFFEYWTALEVLCNGKSGKIKSRLGKLYGIANHQEASDRAGFTVLERWRHDYIHHGKRPLLTAGIERHLQLLFLDLLRQDLELPPRGHLAAIQSAEGYDLSPLGLADNRTEEQKRARAALGGPPAT
jgi:hypothetical protein